MNRPLFIVGIGLAIFACCLPAYSIQGPEGGGAAPTTITHDGGFGAAPVVFIIDPVPFTSTPPLQFNNTILGAGGNQSTATAGNGYYFDSNRFDAIIAPGTSLSQAAPAGGNTPASLKLEFYDSTYMTGGWDNLVGYYNLPLTGDIPLGSSVECILDVTLTAVIVPGGGQIFNHHFFVDWTRVDSGPFTTTLSDIVSLPNVPATNPALNEASVRIYGSLEFRAKNDGGPVSITAPQGLQLSQVPEPSSIILLGLGCVAMLPWFLRCNQKRNRNAPK